MSKYKDIISKLKTKGVCFDLGVSETEISEIEKLYNISFPIELKQLYSVELPISNGFYNWRDMNTSNVKYIKEALERPILGLQAVLSDAFGCKDFHGEDVWCDSWEVKPNTFNEACEILLKHYNNAPRLIPVYSHRYIPFIENNTNIPVFSIMGSDVIYYGENIISYLEIEFGFKKYSNVIQNNCQYVNFWSDLVFS